MIRGGFLTAEERQDLTELARDGLAEHRLARRANALVLLDRGMSCEEVGRVLLIETSGLPTYDLTRRFYAKHGYEEAATLRDFYCDGDDQVIFRKRLC